MNMIHDIEIIIDLATCLGISRALSPFDTGNLRFNAIKGMETEDGFKIIYSLQDAYYIRLLEEGISSMKHYGFIANRTVPAIASYLYSKYSSKNEARTARFKDLSLQGNTYIDSDDIVSSWDRATRQERHRESLGADVSRMFAGEEHQDWYEQFEPNFANKDFLAVRRRVR